MRGDAASRAEYYATARNWGWMNNNEIRARENMNPIPEGDIYLQPLNMIEAGTEPPEPQPAPPPERQRRELRESVQSVQHNFREPIQKDVARVLRREAKDITDQATKLLRQRSAVELAEWLEEYYRELRPVVVRELGPILRTMAGVIGQQAAAAMGEAWEMSDELRAWVTGYIERYAEQHTDRHRAHLQTVIEDADDPIAALRERFAEWFEGVDGGTPRAQKIAERETTNLGQAFARVVWIAAGASFMVWRTTGDTCPYCLGLNGRRVPVAEPFVGEGEDYQPEGAAVPLRPRRAVFHPPAHPGCDCHMTPE